MISRDELAHRCDWVLRRNKKLLLADGRVDPDWYFSRGAGSLLYHLRFSKLAPLMNSGTGKAGLFSLIRHGVELNRYDCVIFCSDTWAWIGEKQKQEAVTVTGQTERDVHLRSATYRRDFIRPDHVFAVKDVEMADSPFGGGFMPTEDFAGRSKMFGDWKEPGMREAYDAIAKCIDRCVGRKAFGLSMAESCELINIETEEP